MFPAAPGRLGINENVGMTWIATWCIGACAERDWVTWHPAEVLAALNACEYLPSVYT